MLSAKVAHNKNEITKLSQAIKEQTAQYREQNVNMSTLFYEGYSQNSLWVVQSMGIDPGTGRELFLDRDGNITTTWYANAKVFAGNAEPKYRGNLSSVLRYKDFTLNLSFGYHWGGQAYNSTLISKVEGALSSLMSRNVDRRVLTDRWSQPGDIAYYRKMDDNSTRGTTRFVMDDNVFQLQSASLQYRWDKSPFLKKINMEAVVFAINMTDLFYISSIKRERGTSYPFARTAGLSVSLTF
jgi:hypothetical protein